MTTPFDTVREAQRLTMPDYPHIAQKGIDTLAAIETENKRLREALRGAANYIDTLGGVSGSYRIELENKPDPITNYYTDRANGAHAAKAP